MSTNDAYLLICYVVALILATASIQIFQRYKQPLKRSTKFFIYGVACVLALPAYLYLTGWFTASMSIPAPIYQPNEALSTFELDESLQLELVAHEPAVKDPAFITFDEKGRIWICEMTSFMLDEFGNEQESPNGKIVVIEDKDHDGIYEHRKIVIDGILLPRSLALVEGGILYADQQQLYFAELKNDKLVEQHVVDPDYATGGTVEHKTNGLLYGMDHWYYNAKGKPKYRILSKHAEIPEGTNLLIETAYGKIIKASSASRGQWGISHDDYGRLYYIGNSTPLKAEYLFPDSSDLNSVQELGDTSLFPARPNYGANRGYMVGTLDQEGRLSSYTAASGTHLYRSHLLGDSYYNTGFTGEVASNTVVARKVIDKQGELFGERLHPSKEFIASTDERFRPVSITSGPDGALYIVDMYQGVIQDKFFITNYLQRYIQTNKLQKGKHLGRIYKVSARSSEKDPLSNPATLSAPITPPLTLVDRLAHPAAWQRDFARRAIVQRQRIDLSSEISKLAQSFKQPLAQINALWTLQGLEQLSSELLISVYQGSASDVKGTVILLLRHVDTSTRATVLSEITNSTTKLDYRPALELASLDKYYAVPEKLISKVALQWKHNSLVNELLNLEKASSAKNQIAQHPPIEQRLSGDFLQSYLAGKYLYQGKTACGACHGAEGKGISSMGPPLVQSEWLADEEILIKVLLKGLTGPVEVNGQKYTPTMVMPGLGDKPSISDQDIANIANYIRNSWSNQASYVSPDSVNNIRKATSGLESPLNSNSISPSKQTSNTSEGKISKKISLFNGKDFTGWKKIGGMGQYRIENAEIIGTAYSSPINTFLATEKQYKDFDLSLEFKVDNRMNSGVQFRSKQLGYFLVKGYQFEIDPSDRSWSGGVYHEAGGGWLFDLSENEKAQQAFKANTWNKARIRVEGSHIQTWINDIPAVDNFDDSHGLGFIALQVHAIWNKPSADAPEIKWRNIFIKEIN